MLNPTQFVQKWLKAISSNDAGSIVSLYKKDAVLLGTLDGKVRKGTENIREYFDYFVSLRPRGLITYIVCHEICSGAAATADGLYELELYDSDKPTKVNARFTFVLEKGPTDWKIISHHSSKMPGTQIDSRL
tara:strand:- start:125 stop:520 length:396 start_codon:yes stop_codon:yes gene_type:complete